MSTEPDDNVREQPKGDIRDDGMNHKAHTPTDDEREARGIIARALVAEGRMDTFSAWTLASELVSALLSLPKADGRYKAALEEAEDYITRHYLDLNIGREVLDILSRANPDRSTGWAAVKQEGAEQ